MNKRNAVATAALSSSIIGIGHLVSSIAVVVAYVLPQRWLNFEAPWIKYVAAALLLLLAFKLFGEKVDDLERQHGHPHAGNPVLEHEHLVDTIMDHAHTDNRGDGKIFIYDVRESIRIETKERGDITQYRRRKYAQRNEELFHCCHGHYFNRMWRSGKGNPSENTNGTYGYLY